MHNKFRWMQASRLSTPLRCEPLLTPILTMFILLQLSQQACSQSMLCKHCTQFPTLHTVFVKSFKATAQVTWAPGRVVILHSTFMMPATRPMSVSNQNCSCFKVSEITKGRAPELQSIRLVTGILQQGLATGAVTHGVASKHLTLQHNLPLQGHQTKHYLHHS